jgi:DNA-directed RNA polymerase beta subunit
MTDSLPDYRHILQTFVEQSDGKQLISHQVESFNQFIEVDIPEIIHMSNPITSYGSPEIPLAGPRSALATATGLSTTAANALMGSASVDGIGLVAKKVQHEYEVTLEFEKISIRKPTIFENNGAIHPMMPNDARLRNLTYAAPLNVDVKVTTTFIDHTRSSIRESNVRVFPNVHLGKIPVMVGSKYCLLHDQKHIHPSTLGECAEDVGGYFIIQGGERAMISMERMSENRPFVFRNGRVAAKQMEIVEIKCIGPDNDQVPKSNTVKIVYHPKNQLITMLRATVPRIKTEIPVVILFRALGVLADKEIYELILGDVETSQEDVYDPILIESILEASGIRTQEEALAWLGEHTNTWSVKSQKQGNVQDIISEELFPQIGGHEMNYEKACFLAHMCRKVLWTITKRIPTDDRDAYPNKRVDIPGFLLADLFRKTYNNRMVKDMKAALSKEIHGGSWKATGNWTEIVNINNINKIIKSTIMDVCLKSSLATGNFGCGKIGGPNKVGVSQVLNRMNYSAGISHLRRISTPIEKTGKLIAPRKQHNSQCGFICPCETPEGHGVGVVKNMAMTTMITIFSSPATVYAFLQRMEKLVSLRDSTIQQKHACTRVFLNGAWIGILLDEDAQDVVDRLRKAKRAGVLHLYTGIIWKNAYKELWLTTEAGRVIRPIYYAPTLREIAADKSGTLKQQILAIREWNNLLRWQTPSGKNLFEYIDAGETDGAYLAMDYAKAISDPTTTHCEIHPSVILGTTASYIPFPDHNQSPRNAYQCLWENEEVLMTSGERKAIKDVSVGEKVMSFHPVTGQMQSVSVIHQYVRDTEKSIYRLTTVSGRTIVATDNHPFITEEGWKSVEDIRGSPVKKLGIIPNWVDSNSADAIHARLYGFYHAKHTFDTKEDADEFDRDVLTITTVPIMLLSTIEHSTVIPEWILSGSDQVKREFLAGFQSSSIIKHHPSKDTLLTYLTHVQRLYAHFGVECDIVQNESYSEVGLTLSSAPSNIIRCYDKIGYRYSTSRIIEGFKNVECLKSKRLVREDMTSRGRIVFVPLESIEEHQNVRIADITVDNENHSFITSHNIGSHNSSMGKQAMGIYALNFRERFDAMSHVLCYPEVPMVSTFMSRFYGAQKLPAGQNIVVAIMTYTGYNQEDSNMINRAALDRGRFRSIFYRTYKDEERKNQSSGEEEKFCRPEPTETKHMKNAHYEKIGDDGFIPRNTFVTPDDILIGKVVPLRVPTGAVLPAGAKKSRDVSKMPRNNEKGYVDKIYKNRNGEGYSFVKIRMRQDRIPEIGDKFSSRHGSFEPYSAG